MIYLYRESAGVFYVSKDAGTESLTSFNDTPDYMDLAMVYIDSLDVTTAYRLDNRTVVE